MAGDAMKNQNNTKKNIGDAKLADRKQAFEIVKDLTGKNYDSLKDGEKDALVRALLIRYGMIESTGKVR